MTLSDEELLYLSICGYEYALKELYGIYYHITWKIARELIDSGKYYIDIDDLILEVMMQFMGLIYQYRSDRCSSFKTYMTTCIRNRLYTSLRKQYRRIHRNNDVLSLDEIMNEEHKIGDFYFPDAKKEQPDEILKIEEDVKEYTNYAKNALTKKEKMVYDYLCLGYSTKDIAEILGISLKSCYNSAYRATKKLRKLK